VIVVLGFHVIQLEDGILMKYLFVSSASLVLTWAIYDLLVKPFPLTRAYAARWVAKNVVAAGLAGTCTVQVAQAIGVAAPVSIVVDTAGTGRVPDAEIERAVSKVFDLTPRGDHQGSRPPPAHLPADVLARALRSVAARRDVPVGGYVAGGGAGRRGVEDTSRAEALADEAWRRA
jgi:hypothetical protein